MKRFQGDVCCDKEAAPVLVQPTEAIAHFTAVGADRVTRNATDQDLVFGTLSRTNGGSRSSGGHGWGVLCEPPKAPVAGTSLKANGRFCLLSDVSIISNLSPGRTISVSNS